MTLALVMQQILCTSSKLSVINSELENLYNWLHTNKFSLHIAKTEFMIIESRQRIPVEINDYEAEKVDSVKSLGIYIDKHLN